MNCDQCRELLADFLEGLLDEEAQRRLEMHLADCPTCRAELAEVWQLSAHLARTGLSVPPLSLEAAVMDRIVQEQALALRRLAMRRRIRFWGISGVTAAAAAALVVITLWSPTPAVAQKAAEVMARGAEAVPEKCTIHYVAQMRTLPADNFSMIGGQFDPVKVEVWRELDGKQRWRVDKPGRVAVMDGTSTTMLMKPPFNMVYSVPVAATRGAFDTTPLLELANVRSMLSDELRTALAQGWELKLSDEKSTTVEKKLLVGVETKSGLPDKDPLKNKFFNTSDIRRIYRFDAKSGRLDGIEVYIRQDDKDVKILEVEKIDYDQAIDPAVFTLKLPENVQRIEEPKPLADNAKYEQMTPQQAARAFFEACGKENWDEVAKFWPMPINDRLKEYLGGVEIVSLGEPFQSAASPNWIVPYEIKLKGGEIKKHALGLRKNPQAKRFLVDGGI